VELGKINAKSLYSSLSAGKAEASDPSSVALLQRYLGLGGGRS